MYVHKKYDNFQDEILEYQHGMKVKTFKNEVLVKVREYMKSEAVKATKCPCDLYNGSYYSFGITKGTPISKSHLLSIILYTDYTKLSSNFSSTFRKHDPFDSLATAKKRNQKYWWWSKNLREAVCVYGDTFARSRSNSPNTGKLIGPFYSGMSMVLKIPDFNITLLSPTSTTLHIEVAIKFSGHRGIIIEMNNDKVGRTTKAMDVSWLSRYPEEEERHVYF